jgi:hypothetical protein
MALVCSALLLLVLAAHNGVFGGPGAVMATLATASICLLVRILSLPVPQVAWLFYMLYPLHLAIIALTQDKYFG